MPDNTFSVEPDPPKPVPERLLIIRGFNALEDLDERYDVSAIRDAFAYSDFMTKIRTGDWPRIVIVDPRRSTEEMRADPDFQLAWTMFMAEDRMRLYCLDLAFPEVMTMPCRFANPEGKQVEILVFGQEFFEKLRPHRDQPWLRVLASHLSPMFVTDSWFKPYAGDTDLLERLAHNTVLRVNKLDNDVRDVVVVDRVTDGLVANGFHLPLVSYVGNPLDTIW